MRPRRKVGEVVDNWSLRKFLGRGGNAEVWRAERLDGKIAALKVLYTTQPRTEPYQRFCAEIEILRELGEYPGILPIVDAHIPDHPSHSSPAWLAMPVAKPIHMALGSQPLLKTVVEAISTIAGTLASLAVEHHIYHRDIKPANLYQFEHHWCVGDFGLVDYPDKASLTAPGKWVGPIHYLAPELLLDPDNADSGLADVYALAKTLWVLATRQNWPLPGHLSREFMQFRISAYIADERAHIIETLIEKATHPQPEKRPSMLDMANELSAWLETPSSPPPIVDLPGLQSKISPTIERYKKHKDLQERCRAHVQKVIQDLPKRLEPLARSLQEVTGLEVPIGHAFGFGRDPLLNIPEIHARLGSPDHVFHLCSRFFVKSPESIKTGANQSSFIELHGGVIIEITKDGTLYISGAYGLCRGTGKLDTVWLKTQTAEFETAREDQALTSILKELYSEFPAAVTAFGEELKTWLS
jgi:serine/threonine protein kinase